MTSILPLTFDYCVPPTGSTSSSMSDHWLIRLAGESKRGSVVSRSSTTCPSSIPDSPESPVFHEEPSKDERGLSILSSAILNRVSINLLGIWAIISIKNRKIKVIQSFLHYYENNIKELFSEIHFASGAECIRLCTDAQNVAYFLPYLPSRWL